MLEQERLIARVGGLCRADERLTAALTYGSFAYGAGDAHSDIEFWLFFDPAAVTTAAARRAWLAQIGETRHVVVNEFGAHVVFFPGLVRGEFHFATADEIAAVARWPARSGPIERMIVVDRTGTLRAALASLPATPALPATAAEIEQLCGRFANWLVLAHHVARRGELLRAEDALGHARRHLLWMARLAENRTGHWLTPSRNVERDLPGLGATATRGEVWALGRHYWRQLAGRAGTPVPEALVAELDAALSTGC